jgi:hypothetical protein
MAVRRIIGSLGGLVLLLLVVVSSALAARPSSGFTGTWVGTDPGDGSNLTLVVAGDSTTQSTLTDDDATTACQGAATSEFTAHLVGKVDGNVMDTVIENARCGTVPRPFIHGTQIVWFLDDGGNADPSDDVLTNTFGETYTRAA